MNRRRGKTLSTNIPIYSLSGGVGRQAPSKRLPTESQELENAMITVERSLEKRSGTDLMPIFNPGSQAFTGDDLGLPTANTTLEFFWHALSENARYLIVIDRSATVSGNKLYYVFYYNPTTDTFIDHTPATQTDSEIPADVRAYLTYQASGDPLKLVAQGQNVVFLNPNVHAGYTSKKVTLAVGDFLDSGTGAAALTSGQEGDYYLQIGFDGKVIGDGSDASNTYKQDLKGAKEEYKTAIKVDPGAIAILWDQYSSYARGTQVLVVPGTADLTGSVGTSNDNGIEATEDDINTGTYVGKVQKSYILQAVTSIEANENIAKKAKWTVIATDASNFGTATSSLTLPALDTDRTPKQIEVKDWEYADSSKPQLGQSLPTFNDLTIPPLQIDVTDGNNGAEDMLVALYGLTKNAAANFPLTNSADGKVYYIQTGFQGQAPGYYLAKSTTSPHFLKVRTPDEYSVFDNKRMPITFEFTGINSSGVSQWEFKLLNWEHRTSGTEKNLNPGPTPFKEGKQSKIATIAYFRNRLFMSSGDVIFSSRDGDFTDLWIEDPGLVVDSDPIDVAASANKFTPITSMVPFSDYMFVNTNADTQYELMGSENQITPFTASLQPMTFYSTAPLVDPLTLGNNIFFYDAERLYLYLGRGGSLSTAQELSSHCAKYLPKNYGATAVAAAQDTLLSVDADNPTDVYLYTTKYRGNQIAQNAFYKYIFEDVSVMSMQSWDNYVYMVMKTSGDEYRIERQLMRNDPNNIPRLDKKQKLTITLGDTLGTSRDGVNGVYNADVNETTVRIPYKMDASKSYEFVDVNGGIYTIKTITPSTNHTDIVVKGDHFQADQQLLAGGNYYIGRKFTMMAQLSTQFVRGRDNNPMEGILNLASMVTRHYNTGDYDIVVQRRGRPTSSVVTDYKANSKDLLNYTTTFAAPQVDTFNNSSLDISNIEYQGELVSKIMGYSDKVEIYILSDYMTPLNITNIEIKGKFKQTYSSVL